VHSNLRESVRAQEREVEKMTFRSRDLTTSRFRGFLDLSISRIAARQVLEKEAL
jgi:hypothetical protein